MHHAFNSMGGCIQRGTRRLHSVTLFNSELLFNVKAIHIFCSPLPQKVYALRTAALAPKEPCVSNRKYDDDDHGDDSNNKYVWWLFLLGPVGAMNLPTIARADSPLWQAANLMTTIASPRPSCHSLNYETSAISVMTQRTTGRLQQNRISCVRGNLPLKWSTVTQTFDSWVSGKEKNNTVFILLLVSLLHKGV